MSSVHFQSKIPANPIHTNPSSFPIFDAFGKSGSKALNVSKTPSDTEYKVQLIENLSLNQFCLASLSYPLSDTNLAAAEASFSLTKEAHNCIANATNVVVFNISDCPRHCHWFRLPLQSLQYGPPPLPIPRAPE